MDDDEEAPRPSEGDGGKAKEKPNSGCGGCLLPIILIVLTVYCSFDKSDFYLMPGETNLWTDAMEEVFDNIDQVIPDSLELHDDLQVLDHGESYINKENIMYGIHPFIRLRSKTNAENEYLIRVLGIVLHKAPGEFEIRSLEMDTLINIQEYKRSRELLKPE